jgi:hypothetical protein
MVKAHWFNPFTRTTSDRLRQALMLSTTARSKLGTGRC